MTFGQHYVDYYDLFYENKDYGGEVEYVRGIIDRYNKNATSIIDLGCGSGRHSRLLAERGFATVIVP